MNRRQTDVPAFTVASNDPFGGVVELVTVCVVESRLVHCTIVPIGTVMLVGMNAKFWIETAVVPLPGQDTISTVDVAVVCHLPS